VKDDFMIDGRRIAVVLPAYNAARTLRRTYDEIPHAIVDDVILTDDASSDDTLAVARALGIHTLVHADNRGYGANQKSCYAAALERGADIVVMLHPDYQYTPRLVTAMASMIASDQYDVVLASRILGNGALAGGMPLYKYVFNRLLTLFQNALMGQKLSEYHSGYRAWSRRVLEHMPLLACSDDFLFDNQMMAQAAWFGFRIGEISCPTHYFPEASSINLPRSIVYGLGVLKTSIAYRLARWGLARPAIFAADPCETLGRVTLPELLAGARRHEPGQGKRGGPRRAAAAQDPLPEHFIALAMDARGRSAAASPLSVGE
jgi:glycosyltransferase involved in cell wall biosynthesis